MSSLLTIDDARLKDVLEQTSPPDYVATEARSITATLEAQKSDSFLGGTETLPSSPPNNAEAQKLLLLLRRKIEESGVPLKSEAELNDEIDEMRRRKS